ncbi:thioredoxin-like domain-containing protein [Larkinella sp. C7]|uniref:thioredoxin-like domain-containing protein n=1 Tax=Larkinella sp. C7 TaxID=2576607 RepID=UPI00111105AB|nr:thioredoxin-like domain-containing protein [Larkinella sp. C7]
MNRRFCFTAFLLLLSAPFVRAQSSEGHLVTAKIKGLANKTAYLAHFYGQTQFTPRDTATADAEGRLVFDGPKELPGGLYMIVVDAKPVLQLVIGEQRFSIEADTVNVIESMKVTGSRENELFYGYQKFLSKKYGEISALQKSGGSASQIAAGQKEVEAYRKDFMAKNANTLTVKLFRAAEEPEIPEAPKLANGRPDSNFVFNYYRNHFLDGFDFSDERLMRTHFLQTKLDRYLKELTVQTVDSLIPAADYLVNKAKANKEILQYTIWYITNQYEEQKKVLNTDGLFIHMAEKYWLTGVMPVSDTSTLTSMRDRVKILKPLLAGKTLPNVSLKDTLGRFQALHNVKAEYTITFFYDPECGHCRESAPALKKFYDKHKAKGVQIYAVAIGKTEAIWKKFIREFKLQSLLNVYGPSAPVDYKTKYDVYSTPTVYVLDKDKKILARRLPVEDLEGYFNFLQQQKMTKKPAPMKDAKASVKGKP